MKKTKPGQNTFQNVAKEATARVPNPEMIKILAANKIKVMFRTDGPNMLLWCNYGAHTKQKLGDGFEVWGRGSKILEHIKTTVFRYYPLAEITSEAANMHVVFALNEK